MIHLTNENFRRETEFAEQPVLIDFYQDNCVPCRNMEPVFDKLEAIYGERYKFCKADVAAQEGLAQQFDILSVPTIIMMLDGEILHRVNGLRSEEELCSILNLS